MIKCEIKNVDENLVGCASISVDGDLEEIANDVFALMCWFYDMYPQHFKIISENFKNHVMNKED